MHFDEVERKRRKISVNIQKMSDTSCMRLGSCFTSEFFFSTTTYYRVSHSQGLAPVVFLDKTHEWWIIVVIIWDDFEAGSDQPTLVLEVTHQGHCLEQNEQNFIQIFHISWIWIKHEPSKLRDCKNICWCYGTGSLPEKYDFCNFNKILKYLSIYCP